MLVIDMKQIGKTNYQKNYPFMKGEHVLPEIKRLILNWIESGVAEQCDPHELDYISPLLLVNKNKNSKTDKREYRLCLDLKALNNDTKTFLYHIPNIMEELHKFKGKKSISKIDLRHAFHHIQIHPDSQKYCGFFFEGKYYRLIRMGFGFTNAVNVFQYAIDQTLYGIPNTRAYIDDIYILSNNNYENLDLIDKTLTRLQRDGWRVRFDKCEFLSKQVVQLGRVVNSKGIKLYDRHLDKLLNFPEPTTQKQLHTYVGLLNWFQSFIPHLHHFKNIFQPIITGKVKFKNIWNDKGQKAFEKSKQLLNLHKDKLIYHPNNKLRYCIDVDASDYGCGMVIYQIGKKGIYPIEYYSTIFTKDQKAWHSTTKELYCLIKGLKRFEKYYFADKKTIFVFTDCKFVIQALKNAKTQKNNKYVRWLNYLNTFKLALIHKTGKTNVMADWLSRTQFNNYEDQYEQIRNLANKIPNEFKYEILNTPDNNEKSTSMIEYTPQVIPSQTPIIDLNKAITNVNFSQVKINNYNFTINYKPHSNINIKSIVNNIINNNKNKFKYFVKHKIYKTIKKVKTILPKFKIEYKTGNIFDNKITPIAHFISQDLSIKSQISTLFEKQFNGIEILQKQNKEVGECAYLKRNKQKIYYLITKLNYWHISNYKNIELALEYCRDLMIIHDELTLNLTQQSFENKLNWNEIEKIIKRVFKRTNIQINI